MNECSICQSNLTCPRVPKPRNDSRNPSGDHSWGHHAEVEDDKSTDQEDSENLVVSKHDKKRHDWKNNFLKSEYKGLKQKQPYFEFKEVLGMDHKFDRHREPHHGGGWPDHGSRHGGGWPHHGRRHHGWNHRDWDECDEE